MLRYDTAELSDRAWSELQVWLRAAALARPPGPEATCWKKFASQGLGMSRTTKGFSWLAFAVMVLPDLRNAAAPLADR